MGYVYRYIDLNDNTIKYVGIVWGASRTLTQRVYEHTKDYWYDDGVWKIEYLYEGIDTRSEAEAFESHYISLFHTDKYYNKSKAGWGVNKYLPNREHEFVEYKSTNSKHHNVITYDMVKKLSESQHQCVPIWMKELLSIREAAEYFGVGQNKLRSIIKSNRSMNLFVRKNRKLFFHRRNIEMFLDTMNRI